VLLSDVESANDLAELTVPDSSVDLEKAEDAALVREALALLSPAQRAALVMWEVEGRSAEEIAKELGVSRSSVRHLISRARKTLRVILTSRIVDEERGLTAMDLLRGLGSRGKELSGKVTKSALVFIVVLGLFFALPISFETKMKTESDIQASDKEASIDGSSPQSSPSIPQTDARLGLTPPNELEKFLADGGKDLARGLSLSGFNLPSLDEEGVPIGFNVAFDESPSQSLTVSNVVLQRTEEGLKFASTVSSRTGPSAVLFDQLFTLDSFGLDYEVNVVVGVRSEWVPLDLASIENSSERLHSGNYMLTSILTVGGVPSRYVSLPLQDSFVGLDRIPSQIVIKVVLDPSKTRILAQSVWVSGNSQRNEA
jgi:DNA-binding CsgD family transcriptional regulator